MEFNKREDKILQIFFEQPLRKFRFKDIVEIAGLHRDNANNWISRLLEKHMIIKSEPKGKYPYYTANYENPSFRNRKKLFALVMLYESGLLDELGSLDKAKAVVIFGSFSRSDWHRDSDIDIFIYGSAERLDRLKYEKILGRKIEIFPCKSRKALNKLNPHLLKGIMHGYYVKGSLPLKEAG